MNNMEYEYKTIEFEDRGDVVRFNFLKIFYFDIEKKQLGKFKIEKHKITVEDINFERILNNGFMNLKNKITKKPTIYVHKNSGIPLIGNVGFGITDRNTSIIEIKPITGCNLDCKYCSVAQDKRENDFVIEREYLVEELKKLIEYKDVEVEVHIGCQGEPLLYYELSGLVDDIYKIKNVKTISMDTNAVLLTKEKVDDLIKAGMTRFNVSINAIDSKKAKEIAGKEFYNVDKIKEIIEYISKKTDILIAPVWVPKLNDEEIEKLIEFAKSLDIKIGIQNYLTYKFGNFVTKSVPWKKFYAKLKEFEKKYNIELIFSEEDFDIKKTKVLKKPFKKGNIIEADIKCKGRLPDTMIGISDDRNITISGNIAIGKKAKVRILRDKHNIFFGEIVKN